MTHSEMLRSFDPSKAVFISKGVTGVEAEEPVTIPQLYNRIFRMKPNEKALCWKGKNDQWQSMVYIEYKNLIYNVAKSFLKVFFPDYECVSLCLYVAWS